jgi:nitrogen regulatory protein PII
VRVEVVVPTELADKVVEAIIGSARTGQIGDGKIFITSIDQAIRIRTGETGESAL